MKRTVALLVGALVCGLALMAGLTLSIRAASPLRPTPTPGIPSPQDLSATEPPVQGLRQLPDLVVQSISLDEPARLGITSTIRVVVKNIGTADVASSNNFFVDLYVDPAAPPEPGRPGEPGTLTMGVQGYLFRVGQPVPLLFHYAFTRTRSYDLYARADTDGDVVESNEDNNVLGPIIANARTGTWVADVNHEDFQAGFSNMDTSHPLGLLALSGIYQEPLLAPIGNPYSTPLLGPTLYNPDYGVSSYPESVNQVSPVMARNPAGQLYVAWEDGRNGETRDRDIYFARSTDGGSTWVSEARVNRDAGEVNQRSPTMVYVSATHTIYIAWQDDRRGHSDIWMARSTDGGLTWVEPAGNPINDDAGSAAHMNPALAADAAGNIYVAWQDRRHGNDDIYFSKSINGGNSWATNVLVTDQPSSTAQSQRSPSVVVSDEFIYVIWEDARNVAAGDPADVYYSWAPICCPTSFDVDLRLNNDSTFFAQRDPAIARSSPRFEISRTEVFTPGTSLCASPPPITTEVLFRAIYQGTAIHFAWQDFRNGADDPDIYHAWKFEPYFWLKRVDQTPNYQCNPLEPFDPVILNPFAGEGEILGNVPVSRLDPLTPASCGQPPYGQGNSQPCDPPLDPENIPGDQPKRLWPTARSVQEFPAFAAGPPDTDIVYILWSDRRNFDDWSSRVYMGLPERAMDSPDYEVLDNVIVNNNPKLLRYLQTDRYLRNAPAAVRQYRPAGIYSNDTAAPYVVWDDDRRSDPLAGYALERNIFFARPGAPPSPGIFMSRIFEANDETYWNLLEWWGVTPVGTRIFFQTRVGNTPWPDGTWSDWTGPVWDAGEGLWIYPAPAEIVDTAHQRYPRARYLQYRVWIKAYDCCDAPTWKPPYLSQRTPQVWVSKVVIHYSPKTYQIALPLVIKNWNAPQPSTTRTRTPTGAPTATRTPTSASSRVPNDPYYADYQWNLRKVRLPQAWGISVGSSDPLVAVVDTGIDNGHPDLAGKVVGGYDFIHGNATIMDDNGHGTHVAGLIAAATNNGLGVAGVAWNAQLLAIKVLDNTGVGPVSTIANGIIWAADHDARIINMSLGTTTSNMALQAAITHAASADAVLVASAGNQYADGNPVIYPAAYANVIAVGATGDTDEHAGYSETGSYLDLVAPGGNPVNNADTNRLHWIYSTYWRSAPGGGAPTTGYMALAGTSQAAPHVAGLAALILSVQPGLTATQVETIMRSTAVDLGGAGRDDVFGYGRIDALPALQTAVSSARPPAGPAEPAADVAPESAPATEFVAGRVLARFQDDLASASRAALLGALGAEIEGEIPRIGWYLLRVPAGQERAALARLRGSAGVRYAELDTLVHAIP